MAWPQHASPLPWSYHRKPSETTPGHRDWIEDANGNIVVEHVGNIDGPAICAAVNIHPTLADPIPEAPADEEVGRAMLEKAVRDAHKTLMNTLDGDFGLWSSPAFAKAREAVYPLWKRLDETLLALRRSTETDKPGVRDAVSREGVIEELLEASRKALIVTGPEIKAKNEHVWERLSNARVAALRALAASPLTEEQPVAEHIAFRREAMEKAMALALLDNETTLTAQAAAWPFSHLSVVKTKKGAHFAGIVVSCYQLPIIGSSFDGEWRVDVLAVREPFLGTLHVYPAAQLEQDQ